MNRLGAIGRADVAGALLSVDGIVVVLVGLVAIDGSFAAFQGEQLPLFLGGLALVAFGVMIVFRLNLRTVKTGFAGLVAGYFAAALSEFEVATNPCDIGATFAACVGHIAGGHPFAVYEGPMIVAALLFFLLALEPYATGDRQG